MATPATFKKIEEKKKLAQQRKDKQNEYQSLTSINSAYSAPTLQPLSHSGNYTNYRTTKKIDFSSDSPSGRQYTSFERNDNKPKYQYQNRDRKPLLPAKLPQQVVKSIPENMKSDNYVIKADQVICFNGPENFLSSLYPSPLIIESNAYKSVEHYYQACKIFTLAGCDHALQLHGIDSALRAKTKAKQILAELRVPKERIDEWKHTHGVIIYNHAIVHKFLQNLELGQKLLETGDAILAHTYDRDSFYACGMNVEQIKEWAKEQDGQTIKYPAECNFENIPYISLTGKGKNIMGVLNMKVRKQLSEKSSENKKDEQKEDKGTDEAASAADPLPDMNALNLISFCDSEETDAKENVGTGKSGLLM